MTAGRTVSVDTLRRACLLLLDHLEEVAGSEVELEHDYFWAVDPDQLYDVYRTPDVFTVGQLSESIERVQSVVDDPSTAIGYGMVWLSDVMRAIGQSATG